MQIALLTILLGSAFAAPATQGTGYIVRVAENTPLDSVLNAVPGVNVLSRWFRTDTDTNVISGTSMATPHVAGALAYLLSNPTFAKSSPAQLKQTLISMSQKDKVTLGQTSGFLGLFRQQVSRTTVNNLLQI